MRAPWVGRAKAKEPGIRGSRTGLSEPVAMPEIAQLTFNNAPFLVQNQDGSVLGQGTDWLGCDDQRDDANSCVLILRMRCDCSRSSSDIRECGGASVGRSR